MTVSWVGSDLQLEKASFIIPVRENQRRERERIRKRGEAQGSDGSDDSSTFDVM